MPLSGAERTRRYREKLKNERPEEYDAQKKRNLERIKSIKKKKVTEMSESELEKEREKWRIEKRRSRIAAKMKMVKSRESMDAKVTEKGQTKEERQIKKLQNKCRFLVNKCRSMTINIQNQNKIMNRFKQRYFRLKATTETKIKDLELTITKMKVREEILESTLKKTYSNSRTHKERSTLKNLVRNSQNVSMVSKMLGLKSILQERKRKMRRKENLEITKFYVRDDVSRMTSGRKETRTKMKQKIQIRYLLDTLVNTYRKYRCEGGKYGLTTFYTCKPFYVLSPNLNSRNTCLCVKHSNIEFQHEVLKRHGLLENTVKQSLTMIACDITNYTCMYNKCPNCVNRKMSFKTDKEVDEQKEIEWYQWTRVDHVYLKKDNSLVKKEVKTKKTAKVKTTGTVQDLKKSYDNNLLQFKKHYFNMVHQQQQYQQVVIDLKENEALIVCDFSESYEAKLASEIQSMHFGASRSQISLHTGMIFWKARTQSFCTVAKSNSHQPPAIWAHLDPIIKIIRKETPNVTVIHFYSDGPFSQYRQKNNFYLLANFTKSYEFMYTTWSFFESGHGKSVADGIGGTVKRALDKKVSYGVDIADAMDAYKVLKQCMKTIKVFLIPDSEIERIAELLPTGLPVLKGTLQLHQITSRKCDNNEVTYRDLSCFCGPLRGLCKCFSPQSHFVVKDQCCDQNLPSTSIATDNSLLTKNRLTEKNKEKSGLQSGISESIKTSFSDGCDIDILDIEGSMSRINESLMHVTDYNFTTEDYDTELMQVNNNSNEDLIELMGIELLPLTPVPENKETKLMFKGKRLSKPFPECKKCSCSILGKPVKCMVCKNIYCDACVGGPGYFDFICDACLED